MMCCCLPRDRGGSLRCEGSRSMRRVKWSLTLRGGLALWARPAFLGARNCLGAIAWGEPRGTWASPSPWVGDHRELTATSSSAPVRDGCGMNALVCWFPWLLELIQIRIVLHSDRSNAIEFYSYDLVFNSYCFFQRFVCNRRASACAGPCPPP